MTRIAVLSTVLLASLVASYVTWTAEPDSAAQDSDGVAMYVAGEADLQKIAFTSDELDVTIERRTDDRGEYVWVEAVERKQVPVEPDPPAKDAPAEDEPAAEGGEDDEAPDAEADGADEEPAEPEMRTEETRLAFLGNDDAATLWASLAPLKALRELDPASADGEDVFGFAEPQGSLEVTRRSGAVSLTLGGETYGAKDRYMRSGERVFLVDDATLRPMLFAGQRLVERRLQPMAEADIERVEVASPTGVAQFVQQNRDDRAKAFWARADTPDQTDENVSLWLGKLLKLRLVEFASGVDEGSLESVFRASVSGGDETWQVEVLQGEGIYYARSQFDRGLVKLTQSMAADAVEDLAEVLAP
ncbi:MAG: hypothetical protein ACI8PZ_005448 [Myxococcota bacterium]|jgi:hypothetical protein